MVHFSFSGSGRSDGGYRYGFSGAGKMKLADVTAGAIVKAEYGTSTVTLHRGGLSATFTVFSTGYSTRTRSRRTTTGFGRAYC